MHKMLALSISFFCFAKAEAQKPFQYFDGKDIDYWNEGKIVKESWTDFSENQNEPAKNQKENEKPFSGSNAIRAKDTSQFDWNNYNDPKNPEFWDDGGDWIPPRPFREAVINPTKENIDAYLQWMVRKTALVDRFKISLQNQTAQNIQNLNAKQNTISKVNNNTQKYLKSKENVSVNWSQVKIAYFYQTACPHCRNSIPVIEKLKNSGADVQFIQLDTNKNPPLHENSIPYTQELDKAFHIKSTPTWVLKIGNVYTQIVGEQSFETIQKSTVQLQKEGVQ